MRMRWKGLAMRGERMAEAHHEDQDQAARRRLALELRPALAAATRAVHSMPARTPRLLVIDHPSSPRSSPMKIKTKIRAGDYSWG